MSKAAVVQLNGSSDVNRNLKVTEELVRAAAAEGATLIATPEATTYLGPHDRKVKLAEPIMAPHTCAWVPWPRSWASPSWWAA